MRNRDLSGGILQHVGIGSLQHARRAAAKTRRMFAQLVAAPSGFDADELHFFVLDEVIENADGIRSAADAGDDGSGQFAFGFENLRAGFASDDFVEVAHHGRIRMRAQHAAQQIMRGANVGDPVAHGFVDGVFQRARTGIHAAHFRSQQPHAEDIQFLAAHVLGAHVDDAFEAEQRADRSRGDAVLSGAGFGDDAALAHAFGQQSLSQAVVDFVRAGVEQVFALEIDFRAAEVSG